MKNIDLIVSLFVLKPVILIFDDLLCRFFPQEYIGDTVVVCSSLFLKITWLGESRLHIATVFTGGAPWISKEILRKLPYGAREFRDAELMITMDGEWLHMLGVSQPYPCLQPLPMYGQGNLEEMVCWMYIWIGLVTLETPRCTFPRWCAALSCGCAWSPILRKGDPFYIYHIKHRKIETFLNSHCHSPCEHCRGANCLTPWSLLNVIFCDCRLFMVVLVLKPHKFERRHLFVPHIKVARVRWSGECRSALCNLGERWQVWA